MVLICLRSVSKSAIRFVEPKPVKKAFECDERFEPAASSGEGVVHHGRRWQEMAAVPVAGCEGWGGEAHRRSQRCRRT